MTPKNFSALILNLYQEGHISFDDDLRADYTPSAVIDIQNFLKPTSIFNVDLESTLVITSLREQERERRQKNEAHWNRKDAQAMSDGLKSIAGSAWGSMHTVYGRKGR